MMLCALISASACVLIIIATGAAYVAAVFLIALHTAARRNNPVITTELSVRVIPAPTTASFF
jgi:hypothetical protein